VDHIFPSNVPSVGDSSPIIFDGAIDRVIRKLLFLLYMRDLDGEIFHVCERLLSPHVDEISSWMFLGCLWVTVYVEVGFEQFHVHLMSLIKVAPRIKEHSPDQGF
jgi:hypothetical protein